MEIEMKSGKWPVPLIMCDGCGQVIKRLADGVACYNSKLRTGEQSKVYFSHVMGKCPVVVNEMAQKENEGRAFYLHSIPIDNLLLNILMQLSPQK